MVIARCACGPSPTQTVPAAAAEAGKDVVHQLNNAFAKAFELVAPSVVIIEVTKKADGNDTSSLDDLLFQNQPDENSPRGAPRGFAPLQSKAQDLSLGQTDIFLQMTTFSMARTAST